MINENPQAFDPNGPLLVLRPFKGGSKEYRANQPFDKEEEQASSQAVVDLHNAGYLINGEPVVEKPNPARDERRRLKFEAAMARKKAEEAEARLRGATDTRAADSRRLLG
jgi:hypothetical protein